MSLVGRFMHDNTIQLRNTFIFKDKNILYVTELFVNGIFNCRYTGHYNKTAKKHAERLSKDLNTSGYTNGEHFIKKANFIY